LTPPVVLEKVEKIEIVVAKPGTPNKNSEHSTNHSSNHSSPKDKLITAFSSKPRANHALSL
jgi:hypothetical protein